MPKAARETGPTVGEYFFYAWAKRMVAPKSKRALEDWYRKGAIQHIRPVDVGELTSERYWEKWNRVSRTQVEEIGKIRCHLLTCVIALACLRLLELKVGGGHSAKRIMEEMHKLNCVLSWRRGAKMPEEHIEKPTELQAHILA